MEVMGQPWMNNDATAIAEFLNHLTVKTKHEKDAFFRSVLTHFLSIVTDWAIEACCSVYMYILIHTCVHNIYI